MANFCPNCGQSVGSGAAFCPMCGQSLTAGAPVGGYGQQYQTQQPAGTGMGNVLGTLVAVSLVGGLTRQLYYYGGRYFLDPYCRTPFNDYRLIMGRPRRIRPMAPPPPPRPHGPMGGPPRGPRGPRGPMGGPRGRR